MFSFCATLAQKINKLTIGKWYKNVDQKIKGFFKGQKCRRKYELIRKYKVKKRSE